MGDTVIAYLLGKEDQRDYLGRVRNGYPWNLKDVEFYRLAHRDKVKVYVDKIKPWLDEYNVIGAHRFEQFDFCQLDDVMVLSIDPRTCLDIVAEMFLAKVQFDEGYFRDIDQNVNNAIVSRYGNNSELRLKFAQKRIIQWAEHNILPTDNVLGLDEFLQNKSCVDRFKQ